MFKKVLSFIAILSIGIVAYAQRQVTGTVVDKSGTPVPGASVVVSGSTVGTITDANGHFSINASSDKTLNVSSIGYKDAAVKVGDRTVLQIVLEEDNELLDEVVVTALGVTRQEKTLGYSATTMKSEELLAARTTNVMNERDLRQCCRRTGPKHIFRSRFFNQHHHSWLQFHQWFQSTAICS